MSKESQVGPAHPLAGTLVFWNSKPLLPALHILHVDGSVGPKCLPWHWLFLSFVLLNLEGSFSWFLLSLSQRLHGVRL